MANLIYESIGFISPSMVRLRVKMSDNTLMSDNESAIPFLNMIDNPNLTHNKLSYIDFRISLGFGRELDFYNEFWQKMSTEWRYNEDWVNLGNGLGAVNARGINDLPYHNQSSGQISFQSKEVLDVYWEQYDTSAIVDVKILGETLSGFYGSNTSDDYSGIFGEIWGEAGFLKYTGSANHEFPKNAIPTFEVDNQYVLISTELFVTDSNGNPTSTDIECVETSLINSQFNNQDRRFAWTPVYFNNNVYDFNIITEIGVAEFVNEGDSATVQVSLQSNNFAGQLEIYFLDKNKEHLILGETGLDGSSTFSNDLLDIGLELQNIDKANYGKFQSYKLQTSITEGEQVILNNQYIGSNVGETGTDKFSIIVRTTSLDTNFYGTDLESAQYLFNLLPLSQRYTIIDNLTIDVLDVQEEFIPEYNPSEITIEQPCDIIHHILGEELLFDKNKVDIQSKEESRQLHEQYKSNDINTILGFSVDKKIKAKNLIQDISKSSQSIPTLNNDILKFINVKNTYTGEEDISIVKADDVLSYSFKRTSIDDVITQAEVKYKNDYGLNVYLNSTEDIKVDEDIYFKTGTYKNYKEQNIEFNNYYGVAYDTEINHTDSYLVFESDYIRSESAANALAKYLLQFNKNQHNIVECKLPLKYYGFQVGDLIEFDKMILGKKVYNESYVLDSQDDMPIRCGQFILPLFMITETQKTLDGIKIKAIQMHHLEDKALVWKGDTYSFDLPVPDEDEPILYGDINGDGLVDVLDVVAIVNIIINEEELNQQQQDIADYNRDGNVDILDVVGMVSRIIG
tara:strand:- start:451 stop:2838 length:2388 start_codon:yes stop_codon:yes gene_type:complete